MLRWQLGLLFFAVVLQFAWAMRKQGVAVRGKFKCGLHGANYTKVRIVDIDYGPDPDDTLDQKYTDVTGSFELNGYTHELTPIDPVLYVWHECRDEDTPCRRKLKFTIPKSFIHNGEPNAEQWLDIGTLNLEGTFDKEERECPKD
ncbi:hypothetical protein WR25_02335 [Diploscapter pachys]|uniref:Transthyretin/hydroxyisourate hydrolase domain-containing protein n=1 Tax=Diploscapter pachys TaxID=2018661 RepID=A0A2A2K120_9BILA|nr:hypothetical protein WR25_02335 [Diploscapter pachys]